MASRAWRAMLLAAVAGVTGVAFASGPRWVTGPPYFTQSSGRPVVWYTSTPQYFTDPGDLSPTVTHAQADALVAAAAGVWNVPSSQMQIGYGGALNEHVSGLNTYLGPGGMVFPADAQAANSMAKQIAVVYDSDGSVTDALLGGGASAPVECSQNGVTESVDDFDLSGHILHAVVILNGRCTGRAPQMQLQMQYQLERVFGRVLGVGWSQTNDNVFTATPLPTPDQVAHWPIMHPIDIVCGAYTYQCLPQPFTLKADDVAAISSLYPMYGHTTSVPGKIATYTMAARAYGTVTFPTSQGMEWVNVAVQRRQMFWDVPEAWYETSSVSGFLFQQSSGNPVTGPATGLAGSMGSPNTTNEGYYDLAWIPLIDIYNAGWLNVVLTTEQVNPLYIGTHAVGPYVSNGVAPSGVAFRGGATGLGQDFDGFEASELDLAPTGAAASCNTSGDGVEAAPAAVAASGWWTGLLCAHGHAAWTSFSMGAGRTSAIEVTAVDELGYATTAKALPLIGVWAAGDATGTLPSVAATPSALNATTLGMTSTSVASTQSRTLRMVVADARGGGRPDFGYRARVLYADTVLPVSVGGSGGQIAIAGMGFRQGNEVLVNGVVATVTSWTATSIVASAPPMNAFATRPSAAVDVTVLDLSTGGRTVMTAALTYDNTAPDVLVLVSAPAGSVPVGAVAAVPLAVRVFLGDGVTPVAGLPVTFSVTAAVAGYGACSLPPCVVITDAAGLASTTVTPTAFGAVTLQAAAVGQAVTATFNAVERSVTALRPTEYLAAGATVVWMPQVNLAQNGQPAAGAVVSWIGSAGMTVSPTMSSSDATGLAQTTATSGPLAAGVQATGQACGWAGAVCAEVAAIGVDPAAWRVTVMSGAGQAIGVAGTFAPVVAMVTDGAGHPVAGAPVAVHQTVDAAEMACPSLGRCPAVPVLASGVTAGVSDADGLVSVTPRQVAGVGEVTNVAVAAGTQGFVALSLTQGPR
jgi:hypothetical protein